MGNINSSEGVAGPSASPVSSSSNARLHQLASAVFRILADPINASSLLQLSERMKDGPLLATSAVPISTLLPSSDPLLQPVIGAVCKNDPSLEAVAKALIGKRYADADSFWTSYFNRALMMAAAAPPVPPETVTSGPSSVASNDAPESTADSAVSADAKAASSDALVASSAASPPAAPSAESHASAPALSGSASASPTTEAANPSSTAETKGTVTPGPSAIGSATTKGAAAATSTAASAAEDEDDDAEELLLTTINECFVYQLPPRTRATGYIAASWGLDKPFLTGYLRAVAVGEREVTIAIWQRPEQVEDSNSSSNTSGNSKAPSAAAAKVPAPAVALTVSTAPAASGHKLVAACRIPLLSRKASRDKHKSSSSSSASSCLLEQPLDYYLEPVADSSRYYALRVTRQNNATAVLGIGFRERQSSFDLRSCLDDHFTRIARQRGLAGASSSASTMMTMTMAGPESAAASTALEAALSATAIAAPTALTEGSTVKLSLSHVKGISISSTNTPSKPSSKLGKPRTYQDPLWDAIMTTTTTTQAAEGTASGGKVEEGDEEEEEAGDWGDFVTS